ncbi:hypothetical protein ElyMa_001142600 [Elysia marginata]|uniref:Uncharacterized protein n=1 Tax=Elysia marginata TaxID=1093978 RepID=A0AAV4HYX3_9GAST|nr:hypothetical protein ElyMa_001142600 [Elysia marginata]
MFQGQCSFQYHSTKRLEHTLKSVYITFQVKTKGAPPLTNAERQRIFRQRRDANPGRREEYLKRKHEKYEQDKTLGKRKLVKDMTPREHQKTKEWNTRKKNLKTKQLLELYQAHCQDSESPTSTESSAKISRQKVAALQKKAGQNKSLRTQIQELEKQLNNTKKKLEALNKKNNRASAPLRKYLAEGDYVSFTTFRRLKPFWILSPKDSDRETCLCKSCENFKLLAIGLKQIGALSTTIPELLLKSASCNISNKDCMYGECEECCDKEVHNCISADNMTEFVVKYTQWETVKEKRTFKDEKIVSFVMKKEHSDLLENVWKLFHTCLKSFKRHHFNMESQYNFYRKQRCNLGENEALIHVDFAENFVTKWDSEIQSTHYGASKKQLSLHTGYLKIGEVVTQSFCGVSDSLDHDPSIWAYLSPILDKVRKEQPSVRTIHFFSDGPTAQYRQKINFFLLSEIALEKGFSSCSWNFFEAGHGKGIPDGIGATIKQAADRAVTFGSSICDASNFVSIVSKYCKAVHLYCVSQSDINGSKKASTINTLKLKPVPNTMKFHQIRCSKTGVIWHRDVSCFCVSGKDCDEANRFQEFSFNPKPKNGERRSSTSHDENDTNCFGDVNEPEPVPCMHGKENENSNMNSEKALFYLSKLRRCQTFPELVHECEAQGMCMKELYGCARSVTGCRMGIDSKASKDVPNDIHCYSGHVFPVKVRSDGDCLPASGAIFAFGKDSCPEEIRVRIIHELAINAEFYLDNGNLSRGLEGI